MLFIHIINFSLISFTIIFIISIFFIYFVSLVNELKSRHMPLYINNSLIYILILLLLYKKIYISTLLPEPIKIDIFSKIYFTLASIFNKFLNES